MAADNLMVENPVSGIDGVFLPMHMLCLRDMGLMLGEYWDLTALAADCAADGVYEFQLDRTAAARDRRRRVTGESDCNQVGGRMTASTSTADSATVAAKRRSSSDSAERYGPTRRPNGRCATA